VSTYIRLFRLIICEGEEREEKKKLTGNLVSTLKRTYESLMRMM
jgi:hypothetical protein